MKQCLWSNHLGLIIRVSMFCQPKEFIYELKQSPLVWFEKFNKVIVSHCMTKRSFDVFQKGR